MRLDSVWIEGSTRSGKTTRLVNQFCRWVVGTPVVDTLLDGHSPVVGLRRKRRDESLLPPFPQRLLAEQTAPALLVFAATGDNRLDLADRIMAATLGQYPVNSTTPLGFFQDEVILFWPLLIEQLNLRAQFPLRLRPETEQELATRVWRPELDQGILRSQGVSEYRLVRRTLDLLQLAAASLKQVEDIPTILKQGLSEEELPAEVAECMSELLLRWREWCLQRGFLTYGIIYDLYWRELLPNPTYRSHLTRRYRGVLADDVDEYPAIARSLFEFFLNSGAVGAFTYNPNGSIRLGLGADPAYLKGLADLCQVETLNPPNNLEDTLGVVSQLVGDPPFSLAQTNLAALPVPVHSIQTLYRAHLLRATAEAIADAVHIAKVPPQDIAVIAPGLDAIARYTLIEILTSKGIPVESLNDQRPLASSPIIRSLLTLIALVYPGLGRLVDRDSVAEMLVALSGQWGRGEAFSQQDPPDTLDNLSARMLRPYSGSAQQINDKGQLTPDIDPVRAGLLADYCYSPAADRPQLLPVTAFPRWDRLGYRATTAYNEFLQWLEEQRSQLEQRMLPSPISLLDRAIQRFLWNGSNLPYEQLSALRELIETAQHYWEVDARLSQIERSDAPEYVTVGQFLQLLRRGTISANPFPVRSIGSSQGALTLATIFQYRAARRFHRWHFWLDAGSPLWLSGGAATLFAAPLFLQEWSSRLWTPDDALEVDRQRLQSILLDLLSRTGDRLFLCHSDLATGGSEQTGPLLPLIDASIPLNSQTVRT